MGDGLPDKPKAIDAWLSAIRAFSLSGDKEREASARINLGIWHAKRQEVELALKQYSLAADLYASIKHHDGEANARLRVGAAQSLNGDERNAILSLQRAAELFHDLDDTEKEIIAEDSLITLSVELGLWDETFQHCENVARIAEHDSSKRFKLQSLHAYSEWARGLGLKGEYEESIPKSLRAANLAQELGKRNIEAQMRSGAALGLTKQKLYADALAEYDRLFNLPPDSTRPLFSWLDATPETEAFFRSQRARCRERVKVTTQSEIAEKHVFASEDYALSGSFYLEAAQSTTDAVIRRDLTAHGAENYYFAGYSLAWAAMNEPEYIDRSLDFYSSAIALHKQTGDWWNKGVSENGAAAVIQLNSPMGETDPRTIQFLRHAVCSFAWADRLEEVASSMISLAIEFGARGHVDSCLRRGVTALHGYEAARASILSPDQREDTHARIVQGLRILIDEAAKAAVLRHHGHHWQTLVWKLDQAVKGRSFRDNQGTDNARKTLMDTNKDLLHAIRRVEELSRRLYDAETEFDIALSERSPHAELRELSDRSREFRLEKDHAEKERRTLLHQASITNPELLNIVSVPPIRVEELQAILGPREAYIGFLWDGRSFLRTEVRRDTCEIRNVARAEALDNWHDWAEECRSRGSIASEESNDNIGLDSEFTKELLGTIPDHIDTLFISPHGPLVGLPWHQLPIPSGPNKGQPLGAHCVIGIVPSAGVLQQLRLAGKSRPDKSYLGVACNAWRSIPGVDNEVANIGMNYFPDEADRTILDTKSCEQFLSLHQRVGLLHLACHAGRHGLLLSEDGQWITPVDLLRLGIEADVLLMTCCSAGDLADDDNNEFLGIVRQLLTITHSRAAVISVETVPDTAGVIFSDVLVAALTGRDAGRPWGAPDRPLPVGLAVEWARGRMMDMEPEEAAQIVDARIASPASPEAWSPWFVLGDPTVSLRSSAI